MDAIPTPTLGGGSNASPTTSCCRSRAPSRRPTSDWLAGSTPSLLEDLVAALPDDWLPDDRVAGDADAQRRAYVRYLTRRLESPRPFVEDAERARAAA